MLSWTSASTNSVSFFPRAPAWVGFCHKSLYLHMYGTHAALLLHAGCSIPWICKLSVCKWNSRCGNLVQFLILTCPPGSQSWDHLFNFRIFFLLTLSAESQGRKDRHDQCRNNISCKPEFRRQTTVPYKQSACVHVSMSARIVRVCDMRHVTCVYNMRKWPQVCTYIHKQGSRQASKEARKQVSEQGSKQASEQGRKQAIKKIKEARKQASKRVSEYVRSVCDMRRCLCWHVGIIYYQWWITWNNKNRYNIVI